MRRLQALDVIVGPIEDRQGGASRTVVPRGELAVVMSNTPVLGAGGVATNHTTLRMRRIVNDDPRRGEAVDPRLVRLPQIMGDGATRVNRRADASIDGLPSRTSLNPARVSTCAPPNVFASVRLMSISTVPGFGSALTYPTT